MVCAYLADRPRLLAVVLPEAAATVADLLPCRFDDFIERLVLAGIVDRETTAAQKLNLQVWHENPALVTWDHLSRPLSARPGRELNVRLPRIPAWKRTGRKPSSAAYLGTVGPDPAHIRTSRTSSCD